VDNNFQVVFVVIYGISLLTSLYKLSLGDKVVKQVTNREAGMTGLVGVAIGFPMYLASIGMI
jgi:hypothetical protein